MIAQIFLMPIPGEIPLPLRMPPGGIPGTVIPENDDAPLPGERPRPPRPGVPPRMPPRPPGRRQPPVPPTGPGRGIN